MTTTHLPVLVGDVMTRRPVTVEPAATVKEIAHVLVERNIGSVPVVDIGDLLVGVVSEADLISREGYPTVRSHHFSDLLDADHVERRHHWVARAQGLTAGEIMTSELVTCRPDETVGAATRRLLRHELHMLPVVDDGHLVGVVARHDLLRLFDRPDPDIRAGVVDVLADRRWTPADHEVQAEVRDGVVILSGSVSTAPDSALIASAVHQIPGVTEVVNRVRVLRSVSP